jgi:hypothetical protein
LHTRPASVLILRRALGHQSVERVCRPDSDWRARVHTHNMRYNHAVQSCVLTSPSPLRWPSERGSGARSSGDGSGAVRKRSSRATRAWGHRRSRWRCVCCDLSRAEPTVGPRNGSNRSERVQKGVAGEGHLASISGFALAVRSDTSTEVSPLQGRGWAQRKQIRVLFRRHSYVAPVSPNPASMAALDASSGYPDPTRSRTAQSPTSYLHMVTGRRVCS